MTTGEAVVIEGTWDLDNQIRDLYNAGTDPNDIARITGRTYHYIYRRLDSLRKYGEVQLRPGGVFSYGCCGIPESCRKCGVLRPAAINNKCRACKHRGEPFNGGRE